jgi:hypothetical protein
MDESRLPPVSLSTDEALLLFTCCWDHPVCECVACGRSLHLSQLVSDQLNDLTHQCPGCKKDLTEAVRAHLWDCTTLPRDLQSIAQAGRDRARGLRKRSQELREVARDHQAAAAELRAKTKRS